MRTKDVFMLSARVYAGVYYYGNLLSCYGNVLYFPVINSSCRTFRHSKNVQPDSFLLSLVLQLLLCRFVEILAQLVPWLRYQTYCNLLAVIFLILYVVGFSPFRITHDIKFPCRQKVSSPLGR